MRYRADIDGLRAIAVLLVVGFHAFPSTLPGGYIGVDTFFVISGFLITGLILHELETKQFSLSTFYARRIRRIFPALIVVLIGCFAAGWFLLLPAELNSLGINLFGGAAFSSNLVLLNETSYFDVAAAAKPLLHLWSLGVEEQFYIVWPILLVLAFSRRLSISIIAVSVLVISFLWNASEAGTPSDFYLPVTRAWELMIGGLMAALLSHSEMLRLNRRLPAARFTNFTLISPPTELYSVVGVGLIALAVAILNEHSKFPGWWALLPTLGTVLVLSAEGSWFNRKVLTSPLMVFIGLISYPLYLWHWPLLSLANVIEPDPSRHLRIAAVATAFALAWVTYRWVERPIRHGQYHSGKIVGLCAAMCVIGGLGLVTSHGDGFAWRLPKIVRDATNVMPNMVVDWRLHKCLLETGDTQFAPECAGNRHRPLLFLWGDSFAGALYPGLKGLQKSVEFGLAQYNAAGCPPVLSFPVQGRPHCADDNEFAFSALKQARPDMVLLDSAWAWGYGDFMPRLSELVARLRQLKIARIIILGPLPQREGGLPRALFHYYAIHFHKLIPERSSFRVSPIWFDYQRHFRQQAEKLAEYISIWDALCNGVECLTRVGDKADDLVAFDEAHLTLRGSAYVAQRIAPCLFPELQKQMPALGPERARICSQQQSTAD